MIQSNRRPVLLHLRRSHQRAQATYGEPCSYLRRWRSTTSAVQTSPIRIENNTRLDVENAPPLSIMPMRLLLRTYMVTTFLSSPRLVSFFIPLMETLSTTRTWMINPDRNPVLKGMMKLVFYNNFAAGENAKEVKDTVDTLKSMGCHGVILGYARETMAGHSSSNPDTDVKLRELQITRWKEGNLKTVEMVGETDFVGIKYTGAGEAVSKALISGEAPPAEFHEAMEVIVEATIAKGARIVIDAEQWVYQATIDRWTLDWMRKYNTARFAKNGNPTIYNTMQAYLKSTPQRLSNHLIEAQNDNFTLAFKLVRGAYIASEERCLIHDTKADTDRAYDTIVSNLIRKSYPDITEPFPSVKFVVAGHNEESVKKALTCHEQETKDGRFPDSLEFGQIQGMADEITCSLIQKRVKRGRSSAPEDSAPKVYKALSWGTVQELMQNLIRRAVENRAAVERTRDWRRNLWKEIHRRAVRAFSFR